MTGSVDDNTRQIWVRVLGGLGNQLFQYATGRALAERFASELVLDAADLVGSGRAYYLPLLRTRGRTAARMDRPWAVRAGLLGRAARLLEVMHPTEERIVVREAEPDGRLLPERTRFPVYLDGYWQSEGHFADLAHPLREELRPAFAPGADADHARAAILAARCPVAVHVRRGDYASDPAAAAHHGVLGESYYARALTALEERLGVLDVFVFSDDPAVAAEYETFRARGATVITLPDAAPGVAEARRDLEEFALMATCRHQVIANSTFSWWAAWSNPRTDKCVVAPARWFADGTASETIVPAGWYRL